MTVKLNVFTFVKPEKLLSELISSRNFVLQSVVKSKIGGVAGLSIAPFKGALIVTVCGVPMLKLLTSLSTVVLSALVPTIFQWMGLMFPLLSLDFMIVFHVNKGGFQLLLLPVALPTATLMPVVVKSVGEVEKRILYAV